MDPEVWGPSLWNWLHDMAKRWDNVPCTTDTEAMVDLFVALQYVLPCYTCREHYAAMVKQYIPHIMASTSLQMIVYNMHDQVNQRLHKTSPPLHTVLYGPMHPDAADDALCDALFFINQHYQHTDVAKKCTRHRAFIDAVGQVYKHMGYEAMADRMSMACAERSGKALVRRASGSGRRRRQTKSGGQRRRRRRTGRR